MRFAPPGVRFALAVAAILALSSAPAHAATHTHTWAVSSGDWSLATNWGGAAPTSSDTAYFINGGTATITLPGAACYYLYLGDPNSTKSGTIQMPGGSLSTIRWECLGNAGAGTFAQSGGTNYVADSLFLGMNSGSSGYYNLSGSGSLSAWTEYLGYSGVGTFTQSGGTNQAPDGLYLGYLAGSSGNYNLDGSGLVSASMEYIGFEGTGSFTQSAGTNNVVSLVLGSRAGGNGTYSLSGGMLTLKSLSGGSGTAAFNFSGGTLQAGAAFSTALPMIFGTSGGNATFNTAGYSVTLSGPLSGPGNLVKAGSGTLTLSAANTYSGNTLISSGTLALANPAALAESTLDTSGGGALSFGSLTSATLGGLAGPGGLSVTGTIALSVGNNNASTTFSGTLQGGGSLTKTGGGTLTLSRPNSYTGGTTINAGELQLSGSGTLGSGTLTVNGGTLDLGGLSTPTVAAATLSGGVIQDGTLTGTTYTVQAGTVSAVLAGSGSLTKAGSGTVTLTAANSYTGGTTISAGALQLGNGSNNGYVQGNILDNAALVFANPTAQTYAGVISGSGSLTQTGMGVLTLLGSNTYSGGTTISGGTLQVGNGGAFGSIVGNVTNNAALVFNRSDSYTCGCNIGGTGQLIQAGPGTLTLAGAISSPVFANAGRIMVGPTGMLSSDLTIAVGARVENNASALQVLNFTNSGTFLGSADLSGNFVNQSSGDVRIAGGQRVYIQGTSLQSNSGLVEVLGTPSAPAQFESVGPLTNSGMIAAQNADVYFDGGVTNQGSMAFTYGIGNVFGNVTNSGGTVAIAGSAGVTFYGNVVQDGTLNVGAGSSVVFLGAFSGNGGITTDGPIYFMGNLRPGNSPAAVTIEGSAFIGGSLELSGNVSGDGASLALSAGQQLVLSGSNTYTGGTSVNNGVLVAENASAIPSGSLLAIDGSGSVVLGNPAYAEPLGLLGGSAGPLDLRASGASDPQAGAPVHAVPEPGTTSLLAAGLACGAAIGLKRRVVRTDGKSPFAASR